MRELSQLHLREVVRPFTAVGNTRCVIAVQTNSKNSSDIHHQTEKAPLLDNHEPCINDDTRRLNTNIAEGGWFKAGENKHGKNTYLEVVELAVHLDDGHFVVVVRVGAVGELDAREGAGQLAAAGHPRDGGALVEQEGRVEELEALLLHHACAQDLALGVAGDELGGQHLDHHVRLAPLGGDEGVEVGLTGLGVVFN